MWSKARGGKGANGNEKLKLVQGSFLLFLYGEVQADLKKYPGFDITYLVFRADVVLF